MMRTSNIAVHYVSAGTASFKVGSKSAALAVTDCHQIVTLPKVTFTISVTFKVGLTLTTL